MPRRYKAFTLVEMLIVMGVLIVLLSIGVMVGRFALQKAQDVKHKDAARLLYTALIKYKNINGAYPALGTCSGCIEREFFAYAMGYNGTPSNYILKEYANEDGIFDGGSDATYYYAVDSIDQRFVVVCVSLGGIDDENERGFYCTGDGIGMLPEISPITDKDIGAQSTGDSLAITVKSMDNSDWRNEDGFSLND
ncbi:type II secretion system GspH family protein [Patescibacteria group bacterium]|nr:type II secretion system GspH family protein [Patescibacteria group bacterium]